MSRAPKVHFMAMHEERRMRSGSDIDTGFRMTKCGRLLGRAAVRVMNLREQDEVTCYQCLLAGLKEAREEANWMLGVQRLVFRRCCEVESERKLAGNPVAWEKR